MSASIQEQELRFNHWAEVIHRCKTSGMTNEDWLKQEGIPRNQFYYWQRRLRTKALENLNETEAADPVGSSTAIVEITSSPEKADCESSKDLPLPERSEADKDASVIIRMLDAVVEVGVNAPPEILRMVLREIRHAE